MREPYVNSTTIAGRVRGRSPEDVLHEFFALTQRPAETRSVKKGFFGKSVEEQVEGTTRLGFSASDLGWTATVNGAEEPLDVYLWCWERGTNDVILHASASASDVFEFPMRAPQAFTEYLKLFELVEERMGGEKLEGTALDTVLPGASLVAPSNGDVLVRHATDPSQFRRTAATADDVVAAINQLGGNAPANAIAAVLGDEGFSVMSEGITDAENQRRIRWINDEWWAV